MTTKEGMMLEGPKITANNQVAVLQRDIPASDD
jgi:hypothetical protein